MKSSPLADFILASAVSVDLRGATKTAVLEELVGLLAEAGVVADRAAALEAVLARERLGSTGCGSGVAVPHARLPGLDRPIVAVGLSRAGVDFGAVDGQPVRIFFLILGPQGAPEAYLNILSQIAKLLKEDDFRASLLSAPDPAAAADILRSSAA